MPRSPHRQGGSRQVPRSRQALRPSKCSKLARRARRTSAVDGAAGPRERSRIEVRSLFPSGVDHLYSSSDDGRPREPEPHRRRAWQARWGRLEGPSDWKIRVLRYRGPAVLARTTRTRAVRAARWPERLLAAKYSGPAKSAAPPHHGRAGNPVAMPYAAATHHAVAMEEIARSQVGAVPRARTRGNSGGN